MVEREKFDEFTGTVLIADDDKFTHLLMEKAFRRIGVNTLHAYDGKEAIDYLRSDQSISLAILDNVMPFLSGIEVVKAVKDIRPDVIYIAFTADVMRFNAEEAHETGFHAHVFKPKSPNEIIDIASRIMQQQGISKTL